MINKLRNSNGTLLLLLCDSCDLHDCTQTANAAREFVCATNTIRRMRANSLSIGALYYFLLLISVGNGQPSPLRRSKCVETVAEISGEYIFLHDIILIHMQFAKCHSICHCNRTTLYRNEWMQQRRPRSSQFLVSCGFVFNSHNQAVIAAPPRS